MTAQTPAASIAEAPALESLLFPIREDAPAGDSLRYAAVYDEIKTARTSDDDLPKGVWQRESKRADWAQVERLCVDALQTKTKDLQVAVWLAEAWIQRYGLDGLLLGVRLLQGLHASFALAMFPADAPGEPLSEDVVEHRTNMLRAYNQRTAAAARFFPLAAPADGRATYCLADVEKARFDEQVARRSAEPGGYGATPLPDESEATLAFRAADTATPPAFFAAVAQTLNTAVAELGALDRLLDEIYGRENTGLGATVDVLKALLQHLLPRTPRLETRTEAPMSSEAGQELPPAPTSEEDFSAGTFPDVENGYDGLANPPYTSATAEDAAEKIASFGRQSPGNRAEAYEQIRIIADYLSRIEPHSPVPYLLRRAVRWGSLSLQELLPELLQRPEDLNDVRQLLQIHQEDPYQ